MGGVTDLEMTKLCAEAMEIPISRVKRRYGVSIRDEHGDLIRYDPLTDDAQAMALVKRFKIELSGRAGSRLAAVNVGAGVWYGMSPDDNRAIVECCARMQAAKQETPSVSEHG